MADIAARFAQGDFSLPGFVHDRPVPGTAVMTARRATIRYVADTLLRGGQVRIWTSDPAALAQCISSLPFSRDHRAGGHAP